MSPRVLFVLMLFACGANAQAPAAGADRQAMFGEFERAIHARVDRGEPLFAQRILAGEPGARERYLDMLRAGGSDYPYELVKRAGVDLAQPAPCRALAARMNDLMDRIDAILAKQHG